MVAGALIDAQGRVLIARRAAQRHQGGLWEFPGGKLESGETPQAGLARELREELGIGLRAARPLIQIPYDYPDLRIVLDLYRVEAWEGHPEGREGQPLAWVTPQALDPARFPPADHPAIMALRLPSLYLITPQPAPDPTQATERRALETYLARLDAALERGVGLVQLRAHHLAAPAYAALARDVAHRCRHAGVFVVLNGAPEHLAGLPADGWHFTSARLRSLRERPRAAPPWLGASCHTGADLAAVQALGLDYALLSPVQATQSHPEATPLGWDGFAHLVNDARVPVYALGGLGRADVTTAWRHGAQGVAAIRSLWPDA